MGYHIYPENVITFICIGAYSVKENVSSVYYEMINIIGTVGYCLFCAYTCIYAKVVASYVPLQLVAW